jgi:hypothetical protein
MLGVVGFDGGHKPAIALSIPPRKPVAGEDVSGGGGEGTGACCYDDGTCDSPITQFDCTSAGGTYQGDGTDCDSVTCTGVCCEPGCVDDSTPDSCTADGGTWQGFGTTCADDPPPCPSTATGACCNDDDGSCTITTEADCTGTYQGDDTTCTPNPCCPDCPCGETVKHWTRTEHVGDPFAVCDFTWDLTTTIHCDGTVTCSGSTEHSVPSAGFTQHCDWVSDGMGGCTYSCDDHGAPTTCIAGFNDCLPGNGINQPCATDGGDCTGGTCTGSTSGTGFSGTTECDLSFPDPAACDSEGFSPPP